MVERLPQTWSDIERSRRLRRLAARAAWPRSPAPARTCTATTRCARRSTEALPIALIEDLPVRFQCVAAQHRARRRALVHRRPAGRRRARLRGRAGHPAAGRGRRRALHRRRHRQQHPGRPRRRSSAPTRIFVMHVGRLDRPLSRRAGRGRSRWWRSRSRAGTASSATSPRCRRRVEIHVMPTGQPEPPKYNDLSALRYRVTAGRGREHRPRARRLAELPDGARAVSSPLRAPRAGRAADPRRRVRAARLRAVAGRRLRGALAAASAARRPIRVLALDRWPGRAPTSPASARACCSPARGHGAALRRHALVRRHGSRAHALRVAPRRVEVRDSAAEAVACSAARARRSSRSASTPARATRCSCWTMLLRRYRRNPRIVMHQALALDPLIDMLGNRLPNRFVDPRGGDIEVEIAAMSRDLGAQRRRPDLPRGRQLHPRAAAEEHRAAAAAAATTSRPSRRGRWSTSRRRGRAARWPRWRARRTPTSSSWPTAASRTASARRGASCRETHADPGPDVARAGRGDPGRHGGPHRLAVRLVEDARRSGSAATRAP